MPEPAVCCLLVDIDGFLPREARSVDGWADQTREELRRIIDDRAADDAGSVAVRVENLPPDEWLVVLRSTTPQGLGHRAERLAARIHDAVRSGDDITVTVAVGRVAAGARAVPEAVTSARQAHRSKLAMGPDRVILAPPDTGETRIHAPRDIHRELARAVSRGETERAGRLLWDWFGAATDLAAGDDERVRRWLLGQVLATTAVLGGRLGGGTAADWMAVCEAVPYPVLGELADLHEPATVAGWVDRVVDALVAEHAAPAQRTSTLELVRRHVDERFTDPRLRLKNVAADVGVSPFHVSHLFRSTLGTTFREYVTQRRIRRAQRLLEDTPLGMAQVARASGFGTPVQLRRVLVRETGMTPSAIRQSARSRSHVAGPPRRSVSFEPLDEQPVALPRSSAPG